MNKTLLESVMGAAVFVAGLVFVFLAYSAATFETTKGYPLKALFFDAGGLQQGNEMRIGGVKVGTIVSIHLDPETYDSVVQMTVSARLGLPVDTVAAIADDGIFGGKYLLLEPGSPET